MSGPCLAALCSAITEDGLVQPPSGGWGPSAMLEAGGTAGGGNGSVPATPAASGVLTGLSGGGTGAGREQSRLVRGDRFRGFVLAAAANFLEATRRDAASAALLDGCGGVSSGGSIGGSGWLVLCRPLYKLAKVGARGWVWALVCRTSGPGISWSVRWNLTDSYDRD